MKIIVAQNAGFCFGVKRAMEIALQSVKNKKGKKVKMLREIIHNPVEVKKLTEAGINCVNDIEEIKQGDSVIISAHGITLNEEKILKSKNVNLIDTTCPYVKKIHNIVKVLNMENYQVVIIGDKEHYEVKGIMGHSGKNTVVISSKDDLNEIKLEKKIGVVAQTTQNIEVFKKLINSLMDIALNNGVTEIKIFNTICDATYKRQEETKNIAKEAEVMIIIGGKNSANTRRLFDICKEILKDVHYVESDRELKKIWFKNKNVVGISAGASTSEESIKNVVKKILSYGDK